ncbi:hypothetical protein BJX66DRAFT_32333 [Aspergillus keveii]|uniref:Uncharacterized protein n=1 Tax=Aspergillus keveii TaxID=714993 RepID=A0ABR4FSZ2_9EURO
MEGQEERDNNEKMDRFLDEFVQSEMEKTGYVTFPLGDPCQDDVEEVQRVFEGSQRYTASGFVFCAGGPECKKLLGTDDEEAEVLRFIKQRLGVTDEQALCQRTAIFQIQPQPNADLKPRRAHPVHSSDAISIFRPLNGVAKWDTGLFGIYASSLHQTPQEFSAANEKDIHYKCVERHEILAVSGGIFVQPSTKGGLMAIWQGYSKRPMLADVTAPDAFEFMTGLAPLS